jgi:hypothetical protein
MLFVMYPLGSTTFMQIMLRDKCKIEKTLFSVFLFFSETSEKAVMI